MKGLPRSALERPTLIRPGLRIGDAGAVAGEFGFWTKLVSLFPTQITLRVADENTVEQLLQWERRVREVQPDTIALVHFPMDRIRGFYWFAQHRQFAAIADNSSHATVLRARGEFIPSFIPRAHWQIENGAVFYRNGGEA